MTLILRRVDQPTWVDLGAVGVCLVGLVELVGVWGTGPVVSVVFLGEWGVAA